MNVMKILLYNHAKLFECRGHFIFIIMQNVFECRESFFL
jgi:hypothetical protein